MTQQQIQCAYWQRMRQLQTYRAYLAGNGSSQSKKTQNSYDEIRRITQGSNWFLNYIEYDAKNLDSQKAAQHFKEDSSFSFSSGFCSGVHKDNLVLRQLDWFYNDQVEFIIKMKKCESKGVLFDSIGTTAASTQITTSNIEDLICNKTYSAFFDILPFATVDGMNEKGIYASSNVVERRDDIDNSDGFGDSSTKCCYSVTLVRFILDRLDRLDDDGTSLRSLLDSLHLFSIKRSLMDYETHILVADAKGNSKIIEFVDKDYVITDYPVMTNFRTNLPFKLVDGSSYAPNWSLVEWNGCGVERWQKGMEFVANAGSAELAGFKELRSKLNYDWTYHREFNEGQLQVNDMWLTDNLSSDLSVIEAKKYHDSDQDFMRSSRKTKFDAVLSSYRKLYDDRSRTDANKTWITTHSTIYDLSALSCNVCSQMGTAEDTCWNILSDGTVSEDKTYQKASTTVEYADGTVSSFYIVGELSSSSIANISDAVKVEFGNAVTSIGQEAFSQCEKLLSAVMPTSIQSISYSAFQNCNSLTYAPIPSSVTFIGDQAFSGCKITDVQLPNYLESIKENVFFGCKQLTSVTIPSSVITIRYGAFADCTALSNMTIPQTVNKIWTAFTGCTSLSLLFEGRTSSDIDLVEIVDKQYWGLNKSQCIPGL